jgi:hypothetical protein
MNVHAFVALVSRGFCTFTSRKKETARRVDVMADIIVNYFAATKKFVD